MPLARARHAEKALEPRPDPVGKRHLSHEAARDGSRPFRRPVDGQPGSPLQRRGGQHQRGVGQAATLNSLVEEAGVIPESFFALAFAFAMH